LISSFEREPQRGFDLKLRESETLKSRSLSFGAWNLERVNSTKGRWNVEFVGHLWYRRSFGVF
jgi:hypothetical protein